uniref:Uncharacterized protein n=1 Tax=Oryza brachyantha TaxID=4533 RepID=J3M0J0_ORYBR
MKNEQPRYKKPFLHGPEVALGNMALLLSLRCVYPITRLSICFPSFAFIPKYPTTSLSYAPPKQSLPSHIGWLIQTRPDFSEGFIRDFHRFPIPRSDITCYSPTFFTQSNL